MKEKPQDKYWICKECAFLRGGIFPNESTNCVTVISGICGWCESKYNTTLIPIRDFNWKNGRPK